MADPTQDQSKVDEDSKEFAASLSFYIGGVATGALILLCVVYLIAYPTNAEARGEFAKTVVQTVGGAIVLVGLWFTYQTVKLSSLSSRRADRQFESELKNKETDHFFRASEQLGNRDSEDVRIAALYSLERLAHDSDDYYSQVIEVICAFIRRRSEEMYQDALRKSESIRAPHDIQNAMMILGRRRHVLGAGEQKGVDLRGVYLCEANLRGGEFQGADMSRAYLERAKFLDCNLSNVKFDRANLCHSQFSNTVILGASFEGALARHAMFIFDLAYSDPRARVATESSSGVPPNEFSMWERESAAGLTEPVSIHDFIDGSDWGGAEMDHMLFYVHDYLNADTDAGTASVDLSGLTNISERQWKTLSVPLGAKPPQFVDSKLYDLMFPANKSVSSESSAASQEGQNL